MRRPFFSLLLLPVMLLALNSCSVVGSRISHSLRGEKNSVVHTEKTISTIPDKIEINWRYGSVTFSLTNDKGVIELIEDSYTSLDDKTSLYTSEKENTLLISYANPSIWMIPFIFRKDLVVSLPKEAQDTLIYINGKKVTH